jgi:hypothetical protein
MEDGSAARHRVERERWRGGTRALGGEEAGRRLAPALGLECGWVSCWRRFVLGHTPFHCALPKPDNGLPIVGVSLSICSFQNFDHNLSICRAMWAPHIRYLQQKSPIYHLLPGRMSGSPPISFADSHRPATASAPPSSGLASPAVSSSSHECSMSPPLTSCAAPRRRPKKAAPAQPAAPPGRREGGAPRLPTVGVAGRSWHSPAVGRSWHGLPLGRRRWYGLLRAPVVDVVGTRCLASRRRV